MSALPSTEQAGIRRMRDSDLAQVVAIERSAYGFPWTEGIFGDCLRVGYACWVMEREGRIVGYLIMSVTLGEAHVLNLCVDPALHGQGHGRRLLEYGLEMMRRIGAETAFLEVRPSNTMAMHLYDRLGFGEVGVRPGYYPCPGGVREDALILARVLAFPSEEGE